MFDAYVTSSLGLPRNFRAIEPAGEAKEDYCNDLPESVLAANANMELLEILGEAVEKTYFTDVVTNDNGSTAVQYDKLREVATKLERWEQRYSVFAQAVDDNLATCTKSQLLLRYSKCYVLLMLYCPFVHHVTKSMEGRSPNAYACGSKSIEAAIESVRTAEALETRGFLNEAYPLVLNVLAMAATTLLVVELGAPNDVTAETVKRTSRNAKILLEGLALKNSSAAQCLESLMPLYEQHAQAAFPATPTIEEVMEDFTLFTTENSDVPLFNSNLDPLNFHLLVEPPSNIIETFNYPTSWPDWEYCNITTPNSILSV